MHSCASTPKEGTFPVESGEEEEGKGKGLQVWIPQLKSQAFLSDLSAEVGHIGRWKAKEKRGVLDSRNHSAQTGAQTCMCIQLDLLDYEIKDYLCLLLSTFQMWAGCLRVAQ